MYKSRFDGLILYTRLWELFKQAWIYFPEEKQLYDVIVIFNEVPQMVFNKIKGINYNET